MAIGVGRGWTRGCATWKSHLAGFLFFYGIILSVYIRTDWLRYRKETLMSDDLATLETQRSELLEEFLRLGDLRPGSITAVTRRCGKAFLPLR
jgi:hypothetical protein